MVGGFIVLIDFQTSFGITEMKVTQSLRGLRFANEKISHFVKEVRSG